MSVSQSILFVLMVLTAIMVFLTYSPVDATNFWIYWVRQRPLEPLFVVH